MNAPKALERAHEINRQIEDETLIALRDKKPVAGLEISIYAQTLLEAQAEQAEGAEKELTARREYWRGMTKRPNYRPEELDRFRSYAVECAALASLAGKRVTDLRAEMEKVR